MSSPLQLLPDSSDVAASLERLTLPQLQVAEALAAIGPEVSLADLTRLLLGRDRDAVVVGFVTELCASGLCRVDGDAVVAVAGLRAAFGRPLGLGATLAETLTAAYADDVRRIARQLGLPALGRKEATLGPVLAAMLEAGAIQAILAKAPDGVIDRMINLAWGEDQPSASDYDERAAWDSELRSPRYGDDYPGPSRWGLGGDHNWARGRGLVMSRRVDGQPDLPAEVAMVLRGPDYRAPFEPERPVIDLGKSAGPLGRAVETGDPGDRSVLAAAHQALRCTAGGGQPAAVATRRSRAS